MALDEKIPTVNWPTESGDYKVVQLDIGGQPCLRFAQNPWETHGNILSFLAEEFGQAVPTMQIGTEKGEDEIPALKSEWYKVLGMGRSSINVYEKTASFHGQSDGYSITINRRQLDLIRPLTPDWQLE